MGKLIHMATVGKLMSLVTSKSYGIVALKANQSNTMLHEMFDKGELPPVIDGPYPLEDIPRLIQLFGDGQHTGKIVVNL